jgi:hypothetical protein
LSGIVSFCATSSILFTRFIFDLPMRIVRPRTLHAVVTMAIKNPNTTMRRIFCGFRPNTPMIFSTSVNEIRGESGSVTKLGVKSKFNHRRQNPQGISNQLTIFEVFLCPANRLHKSKIINNPNMHATFFKLTATRGSGGKYACRKTDSR